MKFFCVVFVTAQLEKESTVIDASGTLRELRSARRGAESQDGPGHHYRKAAKPGVSEHVGEQAEDVKVSALEAAALEVNPRNGGNAISMATGGVATRPHLQGNVATASAIWRIVTDVNPSTPPKCSNDQAACKEMGKSCGGDMFATKEECEKALKAQAAKDRDEAAKAQAREAANKPASKYMQALEANAARTFGGEVTVPGAVGNADPPAKAAGTDEGDRPQTAARQETAELLKQGATREEKRALKEAADKRQAAKAKMQAKFAPFEGREGPDAKQVFEKERAAERKAAQLARLRNPNGRP